MSNQDVQTITQNTGTFQALKPKAEQMPEGGKTTPEAGKE